MMTIKAFAGSFLLAAALAGANCPQPARADPNDILGWTPEMQTECNHDPKCQAAEGMCFSGPWKWR